MVALEARVEEVGAVLAQVSGHGRVRLLHHLEERRHRVLVVVWRLARDKLEQRAAHGPHVRGVAIIVAGDDLRAGQ